MVYFQRSFPEPTCLEEEPPKPNGNYRCNAVITQLGNDFKNKCYLYEQQGPTSINIEHFREHRNNAILKLAWRNLFFACTHCNITKEAVASGKGLLDCTNANHVVDACISYRMETFPNVEAHIKIEMPRARAANSAILMHAIYNGHTTENKMLEATNRSGLLMGELTSFRRHLSKYESLSSDNPKKLRSRKSIIAHLQNDSAFTAFKRWIIRDNDTLWDEFGGEF